MIKLEEMDLRKYFSTDREYLRFLDDYTGRIEILLDKYNFLGFREEKWKNLITATISNLVSVKTSTINSAMQNYLDEYIKNEIKLLRPRIVCNLIILNFKNKKFKDAIVGFSSDLKKFKISINYEFFTILKEENVFKKIFGKEPITYEEFKFILSGNYEKYSKFKVINRDILWTYQKTNHLLSLMKSNINNLSDETERKIKFVLNHWDYIAEIEKYLLKFNIRIPLDAILLTILNYREDEIEDLREGLFKYKLDKVDNMPPFVSKIYSRCKSITIIHQEKQPLVIDSKNDSKVTSKKARGGGRKLKPLYDHFLLKEGQTEEDRKNEVDNLIARYLREEERKILFAYFKNELKDEKDKVKARSIVTKLRKYYEGKTKPKEKIKQVQVQVKVTRRKNLYDRFSLKEGATKETRKEEIDKLVNTILSKEEKELINMYLNSKLTKEKGKRVGSIFTKLRRHYLGINKGIKGKKTLYDRFPLKEGATKETRKEEIDKLVNTILSKEEQTLIFMYLDDKLAKEDNKRALSIFTKLKKHYLGIHKGLKEKKTLYDRFPLKEGISEETRKEKVDSLIYTLLTEEERTLIYAYLNGKLNLREDKIRANNIFAKLRRNYIGVSVKKVPNSNIGRLEWLLKYFNLKINTNPDKFALLMQELTLIEYKYRVVKGLENYQEFSHDTLIELICNNPNETLETLITKYIEIVTNYLNEKEDKQTL